jgi:hypothetical protein
MAAPAVEQCALPCRREPYVRKCAFDVGDYGLGYCANSLSLGCDCLGHIHYFDAVMANSKGEPYTLKHAVCMHEEVGGQCCGLRRPPATRFGQQPIAPACLMQ